MMRRLLVLFVLVSGCQREPADRRAGSQVTSAAAPDAAAAHAEHATAIPEGLAEVRVSSDRLQLIGVKLATAERARFAGVIRATGIITTDETREAHVHSKLMGWVRSLYVNAVGQKVRRGQPLYSIYSQELFVAQQEYLRARKTSPELATAARERLRLWDIPEDQIRQIEEKGPMEALLVRSPIAGTVLEKHILEGHFVEAEMMLYRIADLSRVWVVADVYEYEMPRLDRKGRATVKVEGVLEPLEARVDYVYPTVDAATRTVKVRLVVENQKDELRPGNFATVELPTVSAEIVSVPEDAVIDTGVRRVVYVSREEGLFRPVEVVIGRTLEGRTEIREGLEPGARVLVSAQFLIDSESRLQGSAGPSKGHEGH